jgi:hypothetical protein
MQGHGRQINLVSIEPVERVRDPLFQSADSIVAVLLHACHFRMRMIICVRKPEHNIHRWHLRKGVFAEEFHGNKRIIGTSCVQFSSPALAARRKGS